MAAIVKDRVIDTSTTTGTSDFALAGAMIAGYQPFNLVCANGDTCYYFAEDYDTTTGLALGDWEAGQGTWVTGNTLQRTTVHASSTGAKVSFGAGTRRVAMGLTAAQLAALLAAIPNLASPGPIGATTPSTVNATAVTATGATVAGGTVTASSPVVNVTQTRNSAGTTFGGALVVNTTETASASGSLIAELRTTAASVFAFGKSGQLTASQGMSVVVGSAGSNYRIAFEGGGTATNLVSYNGGTANLKIDYVGLALASGTAMYWTSNIANNAAGFKTAQLSQPSSGMLAITEGASSSYRDLTLRNLISSGGVITPSAYTTATRPAWVNGNVIFDSDLDKLVIGGVTAWEVVTSV